MVTTIYPIDLYLRVKCVSHMKTLNQYTYTNQLKELDDLRIFLCAMHINKRLLITV